MSGKVKILIGIIVALVFVIAVIAITQPEPEAEAVGQEERLGAIPATATKGTPETDLFKPVVHSDLWDQPVPMSGPVNTAGAEDSPYITSNGLWFFFFFTPDVGVPPEKQLIDGVTGIWWTKWTGTNWTPPEKVILSDDVALDGAECVIGTTMWFASVRAGNYGEIDVFTAEYENGDWTDVQNAGTQLNVDYDIGEFHLMPDGLTMYFHTGNLGYGEDMDLWVTEKTPSGWSTPLPISEINTDGVEGYPFVTPDGGELWFTSTSKLGYTGPAIFRSVKQTDGTWGEPEEIISNFAGESTMDDQGNIYFVHHYYSSEGDMVEADIYVAHKR